MRAAERMMNHSMYRADRATHLKIGSVAFVMATVSVLVLLMISSKPVNTERSIVVKAGMPIALSSSDAVAAR
jgi:hypothetical protein